MRATSVSATAKLHVVSDDMMVERQNWLGDIVGKADGFTFSIFSGLGKFSHVSK